MAEEIRELVKRFLETGQKITETAERLVTGEERRELELPGRGGADYLSVPLKFYEIFLRTAAIIYKKAAGKGDEEIKSLAKELIKREIENIHSTLAILGGRIEEREGKIVAVPIEGEIVRLDLEKVPVFRISLDKRDKSFGLHAIYLKGGEVEVLEKRAEGTKGSILYHLFSTRLIPMDALVVAGRTYTLYPVFKDLFVEAFEDELREILGLVREKASAFGRGFVIPIYLGHSIPLEGILHELHGGPLPISRPVLFKPRAAKRVEERSVVGGTMAGKRVEFAIRKVVEFLESRGRRRYVNAHAKKDEFLEVLASSEDVVSISHIALLGKEAVFRIPSPASGYIEVSMFDILRGLEPAKRGLAILFGCLGAAAEPISERLVAGLERSVSVSLQLATRGYTQLVGTVREATDKYFDEFYTEFLRRLLGGSREIPYERTAQALAETREEFRGRSDSLRGLRALPALYEIPGRVFKNWTPR